jgi:hypothetical protein
MAIVNNILGQEDTIRHKKGAEFDKTFLLSTKAVATGIKTDFSLTNYDGVWRIKTKVDGTVLYSKTSDDPQLIFSSNSVRIVDKIDLAKLGDLYFELELTAKDDATEIIYPWFGKFINTL